jgi:hypothetical protein
MVIASSMFLAACGSSGGGGSTQTAGIGGTGIVAGKITGFGSVFVNGDKYDTDMSQFIVDGDTGADQTHLRLGMVVRLEVETLDGAFTGKALQVVYDDEIEGPLTNVNVTTDPSIKTGDVFGQEITFSETTTLYENTSFETLGIEATGADDVVEISGFRTATGINATFVRFVEDLNLGSTEAEIRGNIPSVSGTAPNQTFIINGITVTTNGSTVIDVPGGVLTTQFVEVKGVMQTPTSILATRVEEEDEDFGDDVDDISLQGVVSDIASGISNFLLGSQRVDASGITGLTLMDGMNIEVEGEIVAGKLIADEVEIRDNDTKLRTFVNSVEPGDTVFHVNYLPLAGTVTVRTDGQTLFEDETGAVLLNPPFSVDDLAATDFVRVEGQEIGGEVVASVVKRVDGTNRDLRLEGAVDSHVDDTSITILGIQYTIDPTPLTGTSFEGFPDSASFFAVMNDGDTVEIDDDFPANGVADEVELD